MVDFEDVMQKIKDLSGRYNEEIDAEKEKQSAMRKQSEDAAYIVKAKVKRRRRTPLQAGGACEAPPHKDGTMRADPFPSWIRMPFIPDASIGVLQ